MTEAVQLRYSMKPVRESTPEGDAAQRRRSLCSEAEASCDSPVDYRKSSLSASRPSPSSGPDSKSGGFPLMESSSASAHKGFTTTNSVLSQLSSIVTSRKEFSLNDSVLGKLNLGNPTFTEFGYNTSKLKAVSSTRSNDNCSNEKELNCENSAHRELQRQSYDTERLPEQSESKTSTFVNECRIRIHNESVVASRLDGQNFSSTSKVTFYKCYICLEGSRQLFSSLPQLIQHLVSHYQADEQPEYSRFGKECRTDLDFRKYPENTTNSRSVTSDYYTERNGDDSPHSPLSGSKERLATSISSSYDGIARLASAKEGYDNNSTNYPSPDSQSSRSGMDELGVEIERHLKDQIESAQASLVSPVSNSSSVCSNESFQKSNHQNPVLQSRSNGHQYDWTRSLPAHSKLSSSEDVVSSLSSPVLSSASSDLHNPSSVSWNMQCGRTKRKFSDVSSTGTPENLTVPFDPSHRIENSNSSELSMGNDAEPLSKNFFQNIKSKSSQDFNSYENSETPSREKIRVKSSETLRDEFCDKFSNNNIVNPTEAKNTNSGRESISNSEESSKERSGENVNSSTALAMPPFHLQPSGFESMHRSGQFSLPFSPLLLPPGVAQGLSGFIGNQQMMSPLMSPTSGFLSNPLAYYAHLSNSIYALNQTLMPQLSHLTLKQQDKGKEYINKSVDDKDSVSGHARVGSQTNHHSVGAGQPWIQPPASSGPGASGTSSGTVKCSSLSRTHSRLDVVRHPIKRDLSCRSIVMPDGRTVYRCEYCKKDFCTMSDVNRHMDFHEDIRPYKCKYCSYFARTNSQLKVHMMRHQGIREFMCHLCSYKGVTQSDLNRHTKSQIHRMKAKNECRVCHEGFVSSVNLDQHYRERHGINNAHTGVLIT